MSDDALLSLDDFVEEEPEIEPQPSYKLYNSMWGSGTKIGNKAPEATFTPIYTFLVTLKGGLVREFKGEHVKFLSSGALLIGGDRMSKDVSAAFADGEWLSVEKKEEEE